MSVVSQVVLTPARLRQFKGLSEAAIQRAIERAKVEIRKVAMTETPEWTGRLKASFDIASTPRSIVWKWDAMSDDGFVYARVVEEGRPGGKVLTPKKARAMAFPSPWKGGPTVFAKKVVQGGFGARNYAAAVKQVAVEIVLQYLAEEFAKLGGP